MTYQQFRYALESLDLTVEGFATRTGQHRTTCQYWGRPRSGRGIQEFPAWVDLLLAAWTRYPDLIPTSPD